MGTGRGSWEGVEPPSRWCPVPHPQDEREAGEGAQGRLCCRHPRAPLPALHVCAGHRHCWCVPAQGARGEAPASGRGGSAAPEVPSAPLCLQTVPRLLGPRPPRSSPRRSPPSQRLRRPPCPAATAGWAGPSTAAGCESLPCPVSPTRHGRHLAAAQGRGALGPSLSLLLPQGGGRPPRLRDGAAVLWLPCEYEGLGEWKPLPRARGQVGTGLGLCLRSPGTNVSSLLQPSLDPLPPYILAEAQLRSQRYCPLCWGGLGG